MIREFWKNHKKALAILLVISMVLTSVFVCVNAVEQAQQEAQTLVLDFSDSAKAEEAMAKLTAYHNLGGASEKYNKITDRWEYDADKKALMYKKAVAGQGAYGLLDALKLSEEYTYKNFDVTVTYYATANALTVNGGVWVGGRVKSDTCLYHSGNDTTYSDTQASIYSLNVSGSRYARYGYSTKYNSSKVSVPTTATQVGSNTLRVRMIGDNCTVWHNGTQAYSVDAGITTEGGLSFAVSGGTGNGVDNSYGFQKIEITPIADDITQVDKDGNVKYVLDFSNESSAMLAMDSLSTYAIYNSGTVEDQKMSERWAYDAGKKALMYKKGAAGQSVFSLLDVLELDKAKYNFENFDLTITYYSTAEALNANGGVWVGARVAADNRLYHKNSDTTYSDKQATIFSARTSGSNRVRYGYNNQQLKNEAAVSATEGANTLRVRMIGNNCTVWHNGTQAYSVDAGITTAGGLSFAVSSNIVGNNYGFQKIEITPIANDITQVDKDGNIKYVLDFSNENNAALAMSKLSSYAIYNNGTVDDQKMSDRWEYDADKKALMYKKGVKDASVFYLLDVLELDKAKYNFENFDLTITYYSTAEALNANGGVWVGARVAADNRLYHKNSDTTYSDKQATIFSARVNKENRVRYGYNNQQQKNDVAKTATEGSNTLRVKMLGNNCTVWHNGSQVYSVDAGITTAGGLSFAISSNIVGNNYGFQKIEITPIVENIVVKGQDGIKRVELDFSNEDNAELAMSNLSSYAIYNRGTVENQKMSDRWVYDADKKALMYKKGVKDASIFYLLDVLELDKSKYNFKNFDLTITYYSTDAALNSNGGVWVGARVTEDNRLYHKNSDTTYSDKQATIFSARVNKENRVRYGYNNQQQKNVVAKTATEGSNTLRVKMLGNNCTVWHNGSQVYSVDAGITTAGGLSFAVSSNIVGNNYGFQKIEITRLDEMGTVVDVVPDAVSCDKIEEVEAKLGTQKSDITLPEKINYTGIDGSPKTSKVEWVCEEYDPYTEGMYLFTGYLEETNSVRAYAWVEVVFGKLNPDYTKKIKFNDLSKLTDFENYYLEDSATNVSAVAKNTEENWLIENGRLIFKTTKEFTSNTADTAVLVYKARKYKNFVMKVQFSTSGSSLQTIGFGADATNTTNVFCNQKNGGVAFAPFMGGELEKASLSIRKGDNGSHKTEKNFFTCAKPLINGIHTMTVVVSGDIAKFYLDDYVTPFKVKLENYNGGYIYLASNDSLNSFISLSITDLDNTEVFTVQKPVLEEIKLDRTKGEQLVLPQNLIFSDNTYDYQYYPDWFSEDYVSSKGGTFKLTLPECLKFVDNSKELVLKVSNAKLDFDPETTIKYYFDNENDFKDFTAYYSDDLTNNNTMSKIDASEQWAVNGGKLKRLNNGFGNLAATIENVRKNNATLIYNGPRLTYYELNVDYSQGSDSYIQAMINIGKKDPAKGIFAWGGNAPDVYEHRDNNGGMACYVEKEGASSFWGNILYNTYAGNPVRARFERHNKNYNGFVGQHHMRLVVMGKIVTMYIDDNDPVTVEMGSDCVGGYIGFLCGKNSGTYDNLSITALDQGGNPISIEKALTPHKAYSGWNPTAQESDFVF